MLVALLASLLACTGDDGEPTESRRTDAPTADTGTSMVYTGGDTSDTGSTVLPTGDTGTEPVIDPGALLFADGVVHTVDLTVADYALETLRMWPDTWVPAVVTVDGFPAAVNAGVRLKGNGSFQTIDAKPSWKIQTDRWGPGEIDGLDELVLNNMGTDASGMRERTAYAVYRELGIPAPRATHVQVNLNGSPYGVYVLLEDTDKRFLKRWFADANGPLYEMFDVDLVAESIYQLDHDGGPDDRSSIFGLASVLADPTQRVSVEGAPWLDVDAFTAYFGASGVIGQYDAYPYSFPGDDVYLYIDPLDQRIHMLPHGGDETFSDPDRPADYVFGLLAVRCLADPACEDKFDQAIWHAQDVIEAMNLEAQIAAWSALVPPAMCTQNTVFTKTDIRDARQQQLDFIQGRRQRLEQMPGIEGP